MKLRPWQQSVIAVAFIAAGAYGVHTYRVQELRQGVLRVLTDPSSATFRDERHDGTWLWPSGMLCGEVNAKNQFGAYAGFRHFVAMRGTSLIVDMDGATLEDVSRICK